MIEKQKKTTKATQKRKISSETMMAITATIVSCCALGVSIYQAYLQRQQQASSVWPYLQITTSSSQENERFAFEINLTNKGIGPAIIEDQNLEYLNTHYKIGFPEFVAKNNLSEVISEYNGLMEKMIIGQNEEITLFSIKGSKTQIDSIKNTLDNNLSYQINYSSVYGKKWKLLWEINSPEIKTIEIEE